MGATLDLLVKVVRWPHTLSIYFNYVHLPALLVCCCGFIENIGGFVIKYLRKFLGLYKSPAHLLASYRS